MLIIDEPEAHTLYKWLSSSVDDGRIKEICSLSKLTGRTGSLSIVQEKNMSKFIIVN